jgi:N-acetylglutamate synthase-like GNAT family acetyltransferase
VIRQATILDAPQLVKLVDALGYPSDEDFVRRKLEEYEATPSASILVYELNGAVIGFLVLDSQPLFHQEGRIGCIMAMAVLTPHRGKGIGRELVLEAERIARECGCVKVSVASGLRRLETHAFYRGLGYEEITKRFVKQLS